MTRRRTRLAVASAAAVGLTFGLAAVIEVSRISYGGAARALQVDADARLSDLALGARSQIDGLLAARLADVNDLARSRSAQALSAEMLAQRIDELGRRRGASFGSAFVLDLKGRAIVVPTSQVARDSRSLSAGDVVAPPAWLARTLAEPRVLAIDAESPLAGLLAGRPGVRGVAVGAPIRGARSRRLVGVLVDVVPVSVIHETLKAAAAAARGRAFDLYAFDHRSRVIAAVRSTASAREAEDRVAAAAPPARSSLASQLNWSIVASESRTSALAPARRLTREGWEIAGIAAALVAGAAAFATRTVRRTWDERARVEASLRHSQKLEAVGRLAGGVAHDFNNVLTVIGANAHFALAHRLPIEAERNVHEIVHSAERAAGLVKQLLLLSRPDSPDAATADLNDEIESLVRVLPRLLSPAIEVTAELAPGQAVVALEATRLEQVVLNLALNARDAMPAGGRLLFRTELGESTVRLVVADSGVGMDEHTRERIFEPFFTTKAVGEGTGLGLSTIYGIVTQAGGSIDVVSSPGSGTTFTIDLPRVVDAAAPVDAGGDGVVPGLGERVLVVEDDEMVRSVVVQTLLRAGYDVVPVADGQAALELLELGHRFDLLLSDMMMPRLNGLELVDRLRAGGFQLPVVLMSGYEPALAAARDRDAGCAVVNKPFTRRELTATVRRLLDEA